MLIALLLICLLAFLLIVAALQVLS